MLDCGIIEVTDVMVAADVELGIEEVEVLMAGGMELGVVNVVVQAGRIKTAKNVIVAIINLVFIKSSSI